MIENSPFHISNKRLNTKNVSKPSDEVKSLSNSNDKSLKNSEPTFWDWFRGLVNPLQNLPIISGIYSSINSDNSESDRDLVQNSLGGFMYGGPIGAIAGFGNWIFNKLFDKTPTEMAFDFTGISNLWKDDEKNKETQISKNDSHNPDNSRKNKTNLSGEWWNKNRLQLASHSKSADKIIKYNQTKSNSSTITAIKDLDLAQISTKYDGKDLQKKQKLVNVSNNNDSKIFNKEVLVRSNLILGEKTQIKKIPNLKTPNEKYRELNFDYPEWKPNDLEISKKSSDKSKYLIFQEKILDEDSKKLGKNLNIKL